ncbi:MAG TPA: multicopper oxidase family protein [Longimicrobium sp.]|nr:multicopper oxidase family protein [Longimicrobium sp.]
MRIAPLGAAALVLLATSACAPAARSAPAAVAAPVSAGDTTRVPPTIWSSGGILETTLGIVPGNVVLGATTFRRNLYQSGRAPGTILPPTMRLNPGDSLNLTVVNGMVPAIDSIYEGNSLTNFHFHGFNVTPKAPAGDQVVTVHYTTGQRHTYAFRLPDTHPVGMHWYHPHPHGNSDAQVGGGMSGAFLVGDLRKRTSDPTMAERVMLFKEFQPWGPNHSGGAIMTLNGDSAALYTIPAGGRQLWHMGNLGADSYTGIKVVSARTGAVIPMLVLAADGNPVAVAQAADSVLLTPGQRWEVVVTAPRTVGDTLRLVNTYQTNNVNGDVGHVLGRVAVVGPAVSPAPLTVTPDASVTQTMRALRNARVAATQNVAFTIDTAGRFMINGLTYSPTRIDVRVALGDTLEWVLQNPDVTDPALTNDHHVFHIHQGDFLVTSVNGQTVDSNGTQDRVNLETGDTVRARMAFSEGFQTGLYVFHCHILFHEDNGMMQNICVYPASEKGDGGQSWCQRQLSSSSHAMR